LSAAVRGHFEIDFPRWENQFTCRLVDKRARNRRAGSRLGPRLLEDQAAWRCCDIAADR
jgi:hypothetical protein